MLRTENTCKRKNSLNEKANVISPDKLCKLEAAKWWKRRGEITQYHLIGKCKWVISCLRTKCSLVGKARGQALAVGYTAESLAELSAKQAFLRCWMKDCSAFSCCKESSQDFCL